MNKSSLEEIFNIAPIKYTFNQTLTKLSGQKEGKFFLGKVNTEYVLLGMHDYALQVLCTNSSYTSIRDFQETYGNTFKCEVGKFVETTAEIAEKFISSINIESIRNPYTKVCLKNLTKQVSDNRK